MQLWLLYDSNGKLFCRDINDLQCKIFHLAFSFWNFEYFEGMKTKFVSWNPKGLLIERMCLAFTFWNHSLEICDDVVFFKSLWLALYTLFFRKTLFGPYCCVRLFERVVAASGEKDFLSFSFSHSSLA